MNAQEPTKAMLGLEPTTLAKGIKPIPIGPLIEKFLELEGVGKAKITVTCMKGRLGHFERFIDGRPFILSDGTADGLLYKQWMDYAFNKRIGWERIRTTSQIVHLLNFLLSQNILKASPHWYIRPPRAVNPPPKPAITDDEYDKLKEVSKGHPWVHWAIILGWWTSMSPVDAIQLTWAEVNMDRLFIYKVRQKMEQHGSNHKVPILAGSDLHRALLEMAAAPRPVYWPNEPGKGLFYVHPDFSYWYVRDAFNKARAKVREYFRRAGIPEEKSWSCLRNSVCSKFARSGSSLSVACAVTGHKDMKVFQRYVTLDEESIRREFARAMAYRLT